MGTSSDVATYFYAVRADTSILGMLAISGVLILLGNWEPHIAQLRADIVGIITILLSLLIRFGFGATKSLRGQP